MVYMYHSFLVHSSADEHLGCFHVLAMTNSAAMNIGVHVSLSDLVSLVCMPRNGIAGSYGSSISSFLRDLGGELLGVWWAAGWGCCELHGRSSQCRRAEAPEQQEEERPFGATLWRRIHTSLTSKSHLKNFSLNPLFSDADLPSLWSSCSPSLAVLFCLVLGSYPQTDSLHFL